MSYVWYIRADWTTLCFEGLITFAWGGTAALGITQLPTTLDTPDAHTHTHARTQTRPNICVVTHERLRRKSTLMPFSLLK